MPGRTTRALFFFAALACLCTVAVPRAAHAQSPVCAFPPGYPGDVAPAASIAAWMAARAEAVGLPPELPVMASLVESGLQNAGDADSVGFFQMRVAIWDQAIYAGYQDKPELQVKWFLDRATAVLSDALVHGKGDFVDGPEGFGRWIDRALAPSKSRRANYQRRLDEARQLIAAGRALAGSWPFDAATPGDDAPRTVITAWMATRALDAGLPGELPVMAALVESGLQNLPSDGDAAGYFGMRESIWNAGAYAGFPANPELQMKWFIDQALAARALRIATENPFFGQDPQHWGEWIADVERPAEQFRGRYQLRLEEARILMQAGCATAP